MDNDLLEKLKECLGETNLLNELIQAMSSHELNENLEHIANMHDIE